MWVGSWVGLKGGRASSLEIAMELSAAASNQLCFPPILARSSMVGKNTSDRKTKPKENSESQVCVVGNHSKTRLNPVGAGENIWNIRKSGLWCSGP